MSKPRITYIDTLKGVCILLVVLMHCGLPTGHDKGLSLHVFEGLRTYRMPTYYFLSGVFFKLYGGFGDFTRRKLNNIIIPLLFFYVICVIGSIVMSFGLSLISDQTFSFDWSTIFDIFYRSECRIQSVIPLWFLCSLFWANLIFYVLKSRLHDVVVCAVLLLMAVIGYLLNSNEVQIPLFFTSSLLGLPFFALGHYIKQFGCLETRINRLLGILQFIIVFIVIVLVAQGSPQDSVWKFALYRILIPYISVLSLFLFCKCVPSRVPIVTFVGRYSLIVLGTHMFLISYLYLIPKKVIGNEPDWLWRLCLFSLVILLEMIIIPFMRDKFPRFTAQKELFDANWKIK